MEVTQDDKSIAKYLRDIFGPASTVIKYGNDDKPDQFMRTLQCENPATHLIEYGTIGLSNHPIFHYKSEGELPVGIELLGVAESKWKFFPYMLTTTAFYTVNSEWKIAPGLVMENVVYQYYKDDIQMKHLLLTEPFYWDERLISKDFSQKKVVWLMCIPISQSELDFMNKNGEDALLELFEEREIEVSDLSRQSVV